MSSPRRSEAQLSRDAALLRIVRTRRFVIAGTAALTAGFAAVVASIAPGRTLHRTAATTPTGARTTARRATASLTMPPLASPGDLGLQGPTSVPQSVNPTPQQQPQQQAVTPDPTQQAAPAPSAPVAPAVVSGGS